MPWNPPGGNGSDHDSSNRRPERGGSGDRKRPAWRPSGGGRGGGNGIGPWLDRLRDMFDGGGYARWALIALALWLAMNCFTLIGEQERGVVLRFGQFARVMQPGPNFKLPWPVESVTKINTTGVRTFSRNDVPVLTRDENIVNVSFNVQYRVSDPRRFLFATRDAVNMLEQVALSVVREQIGRSDLDTALNARGPLSVAASAALQASLDAYRTGLVVTELSLQNARPPEEVKPAFDEVNSAQQMNERLVNEAHAYAAKIVPEARGEAARLRTIAEGDKAAAVARASGDAERFGLLVEQYRNAPEVTRKRLWLDAVQKVLADNRSVVGGDGRQLIYLPMPASGGGAAVAPLPAETASPGDTPQVVPVETTPGRSSLPRPTRGEGVYR